MELHSRVEFRKSVIQIHNPVFAYDGIGASPANTNRAGQAHLTPAGTQTLSIVLEYSRSSSSFKRLCWLSSVALLEAIE